MLENISEHTDEQVQGRIGEIIAEFAALGLTTGSGEEDIAKGESLASELAAMRAELSSRAETARANAARLSALSDAFAEAPAAEEDAPVEEAADEAGDDGPETDEAVGEEPEPVIEEPVAASVETKPSPAKRAAAHAPEVKMSNTSSVAVLTAAADVPNYAAGHRFDDLTAAVDAVVSRARSLPTHGQPNMKLRYGALKVEMSGYGDLVQGNAYDDWTLIQKAGNEHRLSGGTVALTADAWCAPSQTVYDFCEYETVAGLLSVPEVQVTRGGIRYTPGPDMSAITDCLFHVTPAGVITDGAGTVVAAKPCCDVPCPPFTDIRLEVDGACVKVDILANVGYPELTRRYIELALIAHARSINAANIADIVAGAGTPVVVPDNETLLFNLDYLEWYAENMRTSYSLSENASIEVVLPTWAKPLVRAEIGRRNGWESYNVPDGEITSYFSQRNLAVQFVRDWQMTTGTPGVVAVPATMDALIYPSGSWVRGTQGVISLDTIYDSTNLATNSYIGLFTEEASLMVQKCLGTTNLTIPVKVSGLSGAQITEQLGTATAVTSP